MLRKITVEELIEQLQSYPKELEVLAIVDFADEYTGIEVRGIPHTKPNCLVLAVGKEQNEALG